MMNEKTENENVVYYILGVCPSCKIEFHILSDVMNICPLCGGKIEVHHKSEGRFE